jgi:hypothetical protein
MRHLAALLLLGATGFATPDPYRFRIDVPPARQNQFGTATIAVVPADGWRLDTSHRIELQLLSSGAGLVLDPEGRETLRLDEGGAEFAIRFKARTPGEKTFRAHLRFEVCAAEGECTPQSETVSFSVNVR